MYRQPHSHSTLLVMHNQYRNATLWFCTQDQLQAISCLGSSSWYDFQQQLHAIFHPTTLNPSPCQSSTLELQLLCTHICRNFSAEMHD
jgi:hypothetical protein